jgi:hypothetical protein
LYLPAVQAEHVAVGRPRLFVKYPALHLQSVDSVLPCTEVEKGVHAMHVLAVVAAGVPEYVALPQFVHAAVPGAILYCPGRQAAHVPPFGPVYPALHMHAVCKLLAGDEAENDGQARHVAIDVAATAPEYVFAPQSVHVADPVDALYFPVAQFAHVPPSGPVHPALQMQLDKVELATGELEFVGQVLHVVLVVAPDAIEYVPAPQSEHVAVPDAILYFPATHRLHGPPSGPVDPALQVQLAKVPLPVVGE